MADLERLARMEEKLDGLKELMQGYVYNQDEKNKLFFEVRDRVNILEATASGAWKVLAILGTISAMLGAAFAWVVEHPFSFSSSAVPSSGRPSMISSESANIEPYSSSQPSQFSPSSKEQSPHQ